MYFTIKLTHNREVIPVCSSVPEFHQPNLFDSVAVHDAARWPKHHQTCSQTQWGNFN